MALNFPASPVNGQTYTDAGATWTYDAAKTRWYVTNFQNAPVGFTGSRGLTGFNGSVGFTGSQGVVGFTGSQGTTGFDGSVGFTGSTGVATSIQSTADTASTALYPVMLNGEGSSQVAKTSSTRFYFDASTSDLFTVDPTSGGGLIPAEHTRRLTADGTAFGPAIGDYFGANSSISLEAGSMYEITFHTYFLKTTAGTLVWTLTASSAPTNLVARYIGTPIAGTGGAGLVGTITSAATLATAFAATGSLTTGVNHAYEIKARVLTNLATNIRLRATLSAGTITPRNGSYYTVKKISTNIGTFVA